MRTPIFILSLVLGIWTLNANASTAEVESYDVGSGENYWDGRRSDQLTDSKRNGPDWQLQQKCYDRMSSDLEKLSKDKQLASLADAYLQKETANLETYFQKNKASWGSLNGVFVEIMPQLTRTGNRVEFSLAVNSRGDIKQEGEPAGRFTQSQITQPLTKTTFEEVRSNSELCHIDRKTVLNLLIKVQGDLAKYQVKAKYDGYPNYPSKIAILPPQEPVSSHEISRTVPSTGGVR